MPLALITGASSGLGKDFAMLFAKGGHDVVLVARTEEALLEVQKDLEKNYSIKAYVIVEDLSRTDSIQHIVSTLHTQNLTVDVLVNNAGLGSYGDFASSDWRQEAMILEVNIRALTELTKVLLPAMVARGHGRILNVASVAAFVPGPLMAVYYASKAYVLSFSLALRNELQGTGVTVTCLCPGPTKTGFAAHANLLSAPFFMRGAVSSHYVARIGYNACMQGRGVVIPGFFSTFMIFLTRCIPRSLAASIARKAQEHRG